MQKTNTTQTAILPLNLRREELEHLRSTIPTQQRSSVIRDLLRKAGYLPPKTEKSLEAA